MKIRYLSTAMLTAILMTGCINIKVYSDGKPAKHDDKESCEKGEEKENHEGKKEKHHEHEEGEERGEKEGHNTDAQLKARARISEAAARQTAMAKVPDGTAREGELEMENGKLQWSFDIATPDSKDITEVNVNAITGQIINISKETPADQAKENSAEAKEKKEKDDDKD